MNIQAVVLVITFVNGSLVVPIDAKCRINGILINLYCPEKTLVDCFKFRPRLGMDSVLEAL